MAEGAQDKTEAPTPKRQREAREKGQVPRSVDLTSAVGLLAGLAILSASGPAMMRAFRTLLQNDLAQIATIHNLDIPTVMNLVMATLRSSFMLVGPIAFTMLAVGVLTGASQTRFLFSTRALRPHFAALNPVQGIKRLVDIGGLVELVKALVKLILVAAVAYLTLAPQIHTLGGHVGINPQDILPLSGGLIMHLGYTVGIAYLLIGIADFFFQRYKVGKDLKMTKEELKEEAKQSEGNPEVKGKIKARQRAAAQQRMMADVPTASVVVTNPTHYAVALIYDGDEPAPRVVAKGVDRVAARIREVAEEHDVPLVPNPPLTRSLYALCEIGDYIPEELFVAVAEVLAYVFRMDAQRAGTTLDLRA